ADGFRRNDGERGFRTFYDSINFRTSEYKSPGVSREAVKEDQDSLLTALAPGALATYGIFTVLFQ
ncbi:MAG: hypothetical protein QME78_12835, partial [Thermodesulfobacteriota bacterium]|nr:hypothetical protein [Thermodesulfobacteriota bacterium]